MGGWLPVFLQSVLPEIACQAKTVLCQPPQTQEIHLITKTLITSYNFVPFIFVVVSPSALCSEPLADTYFRFGQLFHLYQRCWGVNVLSEGVPFSHPFLSLSV